MSIRIGVDVGGTFTDIVRFDQREGRLRLLKIPSTPGQPHQAVLEGTRQILSENGGRAEDVQFFIHGTTVATNTLLERKGARVALLVTEGFRDVLQIARQDRPLLYDYFVQRIDPLVPRNDRFEVPERVLYTGQVLKPLDPAGSRDVIRRIARENIPDIAVCLLHSYANPEHEHQLASWIAQEIPEARISLSSEILPEFREFERMDTTAVNAYILPRVGRYIASLEEGLSQLGIRSSLHVMQSNGGLMTGESAQKQAVRMVLSGPTAGALSGLHVGQGAGFEDVISIDVGGTSADVALARSGQLRFTEESEVGGHFLKVPMIEINTVGAGGGSIAWIDAGGGLQVGPQSAGADPGPACYDRGGQSPTVTDANLFLGRLNPEYFLGGEMPLNPALSERAITEKIAAPLGLSGEEAAEGILQVVNSVMMKAIRRLSVERGYDPRQFTLVCFGGAGPLQAVDWTLELQIPLVLVPPSPGVSSALGLLTADFRHDYLRTLLWKTREHNLVELTAELKALEDQARSQLLAEGIGQQKIQYLASVDMRYQGQGYSLDVPFGLEEAAAWTDLDILEKAFHERHQSSFDYSDPAQPTEIVNVRLVGVGELPRPAFPARHPSGKDASGAIKTSRQIWFRRDWHEVPIYERNELRPGHTITGPALIEQIDSTTFFYPGQTARVDPQSNLRIQVTPT